jgi:hypothetical protein
MIILWIMAVAWLLFFLSGIAKAHTPPPTPEAEEVCAWLTESDVPNDCVEWYETLVQYQLDQIAEDARNGPVRTARRTNASTVAEAVARVESWRALVASYFGDRTDTALCLMWYESRGNPEAVNPTSGAAGLFQIMPFWWDHYGGDRFDPETNTRVAKLIYDQQGWRAWSPYNRGLCR